MSEIILGDCLGVMRGMADNQFDWVITDPPYGIDYNPSFKKWDGRPSDFTKVVGDTKKFDPTYWLKFPNLVLFGANYYSDLLPVGDWIIWDKRLDEQRDKMIGSPLEMAWYKSTEVNGSKIYRVLHGGVINADSIFGNNEKRFHPTQKPVSLMKRIILDFTNEGDTILDPFVGSGTTCLAAKNLKRKYIGIEREAEYVEIANARLTEKQEVLL